MTWRNFVWWTWPPASLIKKEPSIPPWGTYHERILYMQVNGKLLSVPTLHRGQVCVCVCWKEYECSTGSYVTSQCRLPKAKWPIRVQGCWVYVTWFWALFRYSAVTFGYGKGKKRAGEMEWEYLLDQHSSVCCKPEFAECWFTADALSHSFRKRSAKVAESILVSFIPLTPFFLVMLRGKSQRSWAWPDLTSGSSLVWQHAGMTNSSMDAMQCFRQTALNPMTSWHHESFFSPCTD